MDEVWVQFQTTMNVSGIIVFFLGTVRGEASGTEASGEAVDAGETVLGAETVRDGEENTALGVDPFVDGMG